MTEPTHETTNDPAQQIIEMASGYVVARAIHAVALLGIADHLADGSRSAEELARVTDMHAPSLYRLMRATAGFGLFIEDHQRRFSLTQLGAALRTGAPGYARSTVRSMAAPGMWNAFGDLLQTIKTGQPQGEPIFADLRANPEQAEQLSETMIGFAGEEPAAIATAYNFSGIRTLVDVGGNTGVLLATILLANPALRGLLYDLPHVAPLARRTLERLGVSDRCAVTAGSFFESVPAGGDAYMLSHVVHDWPEEKCLTILRNVRRVIPNDGRLLIVEQLIPPGNEPHPSRYIDLILLTITGGTERTADEYATLLARTGFRLTRIVPTALAVSVIEAEPAEGHQN